MILTHKTQVGGKNYMAMLKISTAKSHHLDAISKKSLNYLCPPSFGTEIPYCKSVSSGLFLRQLHQRTHGKGDEAAHRYEGKEKCEAEGIGQPAGHHAGQHHT